LQHILNHVQLQRRQEQQAIIRMNQNCDCIRFPYGFCGRPVTGYQTRWNLRIHIIACLTNPKREAARIMQAIDLTEVAEGNRYAISRGSMHGDSLSLDDACSRRRWVVNDISSDSSSSVPCDDKTSSGLSNGFKNLLSD
jgi:hypothetical protein